MKERPVDGDGTIPAHHQAPVVAKPRERALDNPTSLVAPQRPTILCPGLAAIAAVRQRFDRWGAIKVMPRRRSRWRSASLS